MISKFWSTLCLLFSTAINVKRNWKKKMAWKGIHYTYTRLQQRMKVNCSKVKQMCLLMPSMRSLHISCSNDIVNSNPPQNKIIDHLSLSTRLNFLFWNQIKSALFMKRKHWRHLSDIPHCCRFYTWNIINYCCK